MDIITEILNINDIDKIKYFFQNSYDIIIKNSEFNISKIINFYYNNINNNQLLKFNNYKNKYYYTHFEIMAKYLPFVNKITKNLLIKSISNCMYGQNILEKIPNIMNMLSVNEIKSIINNISETWTFPIFIYYFKLMTKCNIKCSNEFLVYNFTNSDDRIYKYICNHDELKLLYNNDEIIKKIIINLFNISIPNKYILRRLKYLNQIIPNFKKYSGRIIISSIKPGNINILPTLLKYYSYSFSSIDIINIVNNLHFLYNSSYKQLYLSIYDSLKTTTEKNSLVISMYFKHGSSHGKNIIECEFDSLKDIITKNLNDLNDIKYLNIKALTNMINIFGFHNMSTCLILDNKNINQIPIYYIMPFFVASGYGSYHYNKLRYHFTKYIKNIRKKKMAIIKLKLYPIINELKTKQIFKQLPPYHLYPGQLQNFKNMEFLLKEKADGTLVNTFEKKNIFPDYKIMDNIKAEYIEDLDLYLVFDIDDNNNPLDYPLDNHMIIHNNHPYGQKIIPIINNEEEFIIELKKERNKLKEFLDIPYDNYRWYPKPAWKIINIEPFIEPFIDIINMKNKNLSFIIDGIIKLDGLILTPLKLSREIKIKPKNLYSIDLLYKNNNWIDRDGYKWNDIIINNNKVKDNQIWRLYSNNNSWEVTEIRNDKIKPNPHNIVANIIDLYNLDYNYYYNDTIYNDVYNDEKIIKLMLKKININNILDCGCGSGRIIKYLNKFNKYVGVDIDMNLIGKAINNNNNDNVNFMYCDLNSTNYPYILNNKFNTITCINSIMYFMTDNFWTLINKITTNSAIMLVNNIDSKDLSLNYGWKIIKNDIYNNNTWYLLQKINDN